MKKRENMISKEAYYVINTRDLAYSFDILERILLVVHNML